jgi:hypothetical protein
MLPLTRTRASVRLGKRDSGDHAGAARLSLEVIDWSQPQRTWQLADMEEDASEGETAARLAVCKDRTSSSSARVQPMGTKAWSMLTGQTPVVMELESVD